MKSAHRSIPVKETLSNYAVMLLAFLLVIDPIISVSVESVRWHGSKAIAVELVAIVLLGMLAFAATFKSFLALFNDCRNSPLAWFLPLLVWCVLSLLWTHSKDFSALGLLSKVCGLAVSITIVVFVRSRSSLQLVLTSITVSSILIAVLSLIVNGERLSGVWSNDVVANFAAHAFPNYQLCGSLSMILLPILLGISLSRIGTVRRYAAASALVVNVISLMVSTDRSSWMGALVAMYLSAVLVKPLQVVKSFVHNVRHSKENTVAEYLPKALLAFGALAAIFWIGFSSQGLNTRMRSLTTTVLQGKDISTIWRMHVWRSELHMIRERPLLGTGVGTYPFVQFPYTGVGQDGTVVQQIGPSINDEGHNSYLQLAAELGIPGLALWLIAVGAVFYYGFSALRQLPRGALEYWIVIGCLSALAGESIDSFANPSWQFLDVSLFFWVTIGLLVAAVNIGQSHAQRDRTDPDELLPGEPIGIRLVKLAIILPLVGWLFYEAIKTARLLPMPML